MSIKSSMLFVGLIFLLSVSSVAQSYSSLVTTGDTYYSKKDYKNAIESYLQAIRVNPDDAALNFKLGLAYLYSDTKSKAASYIDKAYRLNPGIDNRIDYHLGIAFQNTNEFRKAIDHFEQFKKKNPRVASIAEEKIAECRMADSLSQMELNVVIENLRNTVNSTFNEYSPIISADGSMLIFTSDRKEEGSNPREQRHEDVYVSFKHGSEWSTPKKISANINTKFNDAAASLSPDGKTLFLYSEEGGGDIYISTREGENWSKPEPLNRNINTSLYWETSASISPDGTRLYFASNRPEGQGELDIYVSERDSKGEWGKAVNLGPVINTPGNDDSPYIHYDGVTLYFSSDGHARLGNSDIFFSELRNGKWTKPENMGYPINSWEYDGFLSLSPDKKTGYYATVKEGGMGGADIYSIRFLEPKYKAKPKPVVKAEEKKKSNKPKDFIDPSLQLKRDQKVVTVLKGKVIDETTAEPLAAVITLVENETNKVIAKIYSDSTSGDFELIIPHGGNYGVSTERYGYLFNSLNFNLPSFTEFQEIDTHIIMVRAEVGSKVVLKNIFFNTGQSDLKNESIAEVEKIIDLLKSNPRLKVQINGHTDNTGNPATNKTLSLKRANAVVEYLITKGVDAGRLTSKGFGSERPIVSNDDEVGGREINRRTEIEITEAGTN
jgi:outer membrane protein OmpA-like peptidoglycan-associated protein/Tol biopolymer transport system component